MKKLFTIGALILLVLVLSGCSYKSDNSASSFDKGTKGVEAHFFQNTPPPQVYNNQELDIPILVENKGTFDTIASVFLVGFDKNILEGQNSASFSLKGVSRVMPTGEIKDFTFKLNPHLPQDSDMFTTPISLYVCYPYETKHTFSVCVSPTITYSSSAQCDPNKPLSFSGGQGAPVAITGIQQVPGQGLTTFNINIANVGGGTVLDSSKVNSCLEASKMDLNKVNVGDVTIPGASVSCSPKVVYLVNGKGQFTCTATFSHGSGSAPYVTSMSIILKYGYKKLEENKQISIIRSVKG